MKRRAGSMSGRQGRWPRRRLLTTGIPAGAAAFLIACGGDQDEQAASEEAAGQTGGTVAAQSGAVEKLAPGHYTEELAASQEELNPAQFAKRGGTLLARYLDPPHFDQSKGYSCTIYHTSSYVYNKAIRASLGATADPFKLELEPDLAEKWEQTKPDATEFVFTFRQGVKWQNKAPVNGRAFSAEDAKLVFERYQTNGVQKDFFAAVDKMELPDANTLKVTMKEPYVDFPASVATYAYITPRELWMDSDKIMTEAVGTGPFIRESWTPKQGSKFTRNPDYWEMAPDGKPYPYVDRLEVIVEANSATLKASYRAGQQHLYAVLENADGEDLLQTTPETVWLDLPVSRGGNVNGFQFNMNNEKFKDKRVRNAISMGINRDVYDQLLYDGLNKGYSNHSLPWTFIYDEFPKLSDQGPTYQYNPAEARKLLTAAGADGLEFEVVEYYITAGRDAFSPAQDMLREIGVNIRNRHVDNPTAITILAGRSFQEAVNMVWGPPNHSIDGWIYPWYITGGGLNYNSVSNPELDNLLKQQRREADATKRKDILKKIDTLLLSENYDIWWPQGWQREAWIPALKNYRPHGFLGGSVCYNNQQFSRAWLDGK
ncbi:MAG: ABC transporter substrate-binding protein [Dehalococcoidia bacterium]